ncbi:Ig-like domain-containing protein, partial [Candidatus Gracilibacteria bacterium]|nr:Ig-like domain-containing protein [Candidatus Gracilibacteria bacterium]
MRKLLSFFRKKPKSGSLEEAQMKLSNTPYPSTHPRAEFKTQLLHNLLEARRHNTSSMVSAHSFTWPSWLKLKLALPVLAAVVIVVLVVPLLSPFLGNDSFLLVDRAYAAEAITITPTASDVTGIEAQTTFKLTSKTPLDADELKKHLSFVPELKFDLNKTSDTEYEIRPTETLEPATVYNIVVDAAYLNENNIIIPKEYRFAFQVKDIFKIARTVPGNKTNYIPVASGIEVTFSHEGVTVDDFKKHFSITPSVAGTFKKNGKTLVFVPSGKLKELTAYTVTVSKGLVLGGAAQQLTEDYSFAFFTTDAYEVDSTPSARFDYKYKDFQSFAPSEKLSFSLYARGKGMPKNVVLKIYKFANTEDVLNRSVRNALVPDWVCENCSTNRVNISGMREFYTQTIEEIQSEGYKLSFPEIKDTGVYVAQLSGNGETYDDLIFQVSQLRGFVLGSVTESILWIQNQTARTPSKGSKITFVNSDKSLTTNDEGIGRFKTPACDETQKTDVAIITAASQSLLLPMPRNCVQGTATNSEFGYSGTRSDYWFTLSTDRSLYLPDDTVNIWGVAQRRAGHSGEDLTIELKSYNNDKPVAKTTVRSNDIGTFEGVLQLKYLSPSSYTMYVKTEKGELVGTHTIQVATFQKPTYRFTITPDKKVVWNGDTATMSIDASFFDGTPIPNLGIDVSTFTTFKDFPRKLTTDEKGHATFTFDTKKMPKNETKYHYLTTWSSFTFTPENAEYGDISETVGITILNSDYNLDLQRDGKIIKGIVNAVDITKYDSNQSYLTDPISGLKVTVMVYKEVEEKTTYQEYDDILKQNVERTKSSQHEVFVTNLTADTDKKGQFSLNYAYDPDTVYRFVAFAYDKKGRETQSSLYYYPTSGSNEDSSYSYYSIQDVKALEKSGNAPKYKEGEKVELVMQRNAKSITEKKGQFLFYTMQAGLMDFAFSDTSRYSFTFEKKHIPNVNVGAVWFDGTYFKFSSYESLIQFDQDEHKIDVNISTDNKTYKPGQKVKVEVQTKTTDGDAISADVNIKAVDEAMYAIQESYFNPEDPLTELYQTLYSGVTLISSTSPDPTDTSDGGKGGGGDGDGITRNLFKITPLFKTVHTDGNGKATVEFDMPHDITAYRVTAQAVSKDLYAGMGRVTLPVTKNFFADVTMNAAYSTQDKPQIRLRGFGDQLKQDQEVKFEISAATLGIDKQSMSSKGSNPLWIALPSLPLGTHTIKVTAQAGDLKDVIEKQVTIVDAFAKVPATKVYDATTGMSFTDIPEAAKRIQLTFSLQPYATFAQMLYRLSNTSYGRLDLQVAATRAQQIMAEDPSKVTQDPLLMYQAPNGGLRLFLYGDADLSVGFKAA